MGKFSFWILLILVGLFAGAYYYYTKTGYMFGLEQIPFMGNNISLTSKDFTMGSSIPIKFTCDGSDVSPSFVVKNIPSEAKSLAIILEDENTGKNNFTHWLAYDLSSETKDIVSSKFLDDVQLGRNDFDKNEYDGPCPPPGSTHKYTFTIYALNKTLDTPDLNRRSFERTITAHVLSSGTLSGTYSRKADAK